MPKGCWSRMILNNNRPDILKLRHKKSYFCNFKVRGGLLSVRKEWDAPSAKLPGKPGPLHLIYIFTKPALAHKRRNSKTNDVKGLGGQSSPTPQRTEKVHKILQMTSVIWLLVLVTHWRICLEGINSGILLRSTYRQNPTLTGLPHRNLHWQKCRNYRSYPAN